MRAFASCDQLTTVSLSNNLTSIAWGLFVDCRSLASLSIPSGIKKIGIWAFSCCVELDRLSIPDSVKHIGNVAFKNCRELKTITIPNGVKAIGYGTFMNCESLASISLPNTVTTIRDCAFCSCISLTSISLPCNIKFIGEEVFMDCENLESATIPSSLEEIDDTAFTNCRKSSLLITSQEPIRTVENAVSDMQDLTIITIDMLIDTLHNAASAQKDATLSLLDLDASSFEHQPRLRLRKEGLQQLDHSKHGDNLLKIVYNSFSSLTLHELQATISLNDPTYTFIRNQILARIDDKEDESIAFLLPILELLSLKDLAKFARISHQPLQNLLQSNKGETPVSKALSIFSSHQQPEQSLGKKAINASILPTHTLYAFFHKTPCLAL